MKSQRVMTSFTTQALSSCFSPSKNKLFYLPQEIIYKIFSHTKEEDHLSIKLTCQAFRDFLDLNQKEIALAKLKSSLSIRHPNLESVRLINYKKIFSEADNSQLESLQKLHRLSAKNPLKISTLSDQLSLKVSDLHYENNKRIRDASEEIDRYKNLQVLVFKNCRIKQIALTHVHLRCLEIDSVLGLNHQLVERASNLPNLEVLNLSKRSNGLSSDISTQTLLMISKLKKLKILCLDNLQLSDEFLSSLKHLSCLKILSLTNCTQISFLSSIALFFQQIELLDLSNSLNKPMRQHLNPVFKSFADYLYHDFDNDHCNRYENGQIDIFCKKNCALSEIILSDALRHMKFKAPLIPIQDRFQGIHSPKYRERLIQNAPFFSVGLDPMILKVKELSMALLTTPFTRLSGRKSSSGDFGVGSFISSMALHLRDDLQVIQAAIKDGSSNCLNNLRYASERICTDFKSMMDLCHIQINAVRYACPSIQRRLYLEMVKRSRRSFGRDLGTSRAQSFYPPLTQELMSAIVEYNGLDIQYLNCEQRSQPNIALLAISHSPQAIKFAFELLPDFDFVESAIGLNKQVLFYFPLFFQRFYLQRFCDIPDLIKFAAPEVQSDKLFCCWLIKKNILIFEHLPFSMRDDKEIAHCAVSRFPQMSEFLSPRLKQNLFFAFNAISHP